MCVECVRHCECGGNVHYESTNIKKYSLYLLLGENNILTSYSYVLHTHKPIHCGRYRSADTQGDHKNHQLTQLLDTGGKGRLAILQLVSVVGGCLPIVLHVLHLRVAMSTSHSIPTSHQVTQRQHCTLLYLQTLRKYRQRDRIIPLSDM